MNLHPIDWGVVAIVILILFAIATTTKKYMTSVAHFLVANRCAGRYLLTMAEGIAAIGVITVIGNFEQFYQAGLASGWWATILAPIMLIVTLSGWVAYRFRQTKAMTMGQFFEMRYSKNFRIYTGILAWIAGIINYGIFPGVTARFFIYFCGIPQYTYDLGTFSLNITLGLVMLVFLAVAIYFTFTGGQIAVMITDFMQGQLMNISFLLVMVCILVSFGWSNIIDNLKLAPSGHSLLNPFDQSNVPDFNVNFFIMKIFITFYGYMAWQGSQGYYCSAKSPHEAKMARVLSSWRAGVSLIMIMFIPLVAYVILNTNLYPEKASVINSMLNTISDPATQNQMRVPIALTQMLPTGVLGLLCVALIATAISTDDTYLHSWGSILIQDVYLPLRKKKDALPKDKHLKLLRISIIGIAIFAWFFSMIFPLRDYIFMFFALTGAIYVGGAGSVIIGGLYWKRGTTAGAWAGMLTGSILAGTGIILKNILWPLIISFKESHQDIISIQNLPEQFPYNGMEISFFAAIASVVMYITFSLLSKPDPEFDLDKMLHREKKNTPSVSGKTKRSFWASIGVTNEFTKGDKAIYLGTMLWTMFWFLVFIVGTTYCLIFGSTEDGWAKWWLLKLTLVLVVGIITTIWFLWGGLRDLSDLITTLKKSKTDFLDNGEVDHHHNINETEKTMS